ncbi:MAG: CHASE2 domain-containing protein [Phormidesmis sp. RL_2_1]|nr:CHASE2 domain-containing protein [Phormidesmis sp. RL_2_1]
MTKPKLAKQRLAEQASKGDETATLTPRDRFTAWQQKAMAQHWRSALSTACVVVAASAVGMNLGIVNFWERQVQSLFFELRGPVATPADIVILAIDEESLTQGQYYLENPQRYAALKTIESWPWQRQAYAQVITRLMDSGAKAVALDMLFPSPSAYGKEDDDIFTEVLSRYGDRIVLAANYNNISLRQGDLSQPSLPLKQFQDTGVRVGSVTFRKEMNGKIHRLGEEFLKELALDDAELFGAPMAGDETSLPLSFAQATLQAARVPYSLKPQENVFFFGPSGSFRQIPFWYVLDDDPWQNQLAAGRAFEDKIVIIGTTADIHQDFHEAPFSQSFLYPEPMAGVEVLANTIATLRDNLAPVQPIKSPWVNALVVLSFGLGWVVLMNRTPKPLGRALIAGSGVALWALVGYGAFVGGRTVLITGTPMVAIATLGLLDIGASITAERLKRKRLRTTLARYVTSPLVQEIISQQEDFQDLLAISRADLIGTLLGDRYRIVNILGAGGFGETYLAQDSLRPGHPVCVVKQLKIVSDNPKAHHLAQRLFEAEAVVLGQLGEHEQIPRLLAYFEMQQSFYLVQEMIEGELLRDLLSRSRPFSPRAVVELLRDLLPVIGFVHAKGVIHRDIKPSNIIRRERDSRYVLIDFGAVKTISTQLSEADTTQAGAPATSTIGIGTQGYMPSEQSAGMPNIRSDIYALGITAIEALTGKPPHSLKYSDSGEIIWSHTLADMNPAFTQIINKMVRYDFNQRYPSAQSVLNDIEQLNDQQLSDAPIDLDQRFALDEAATYSQGTRPGVIDTNTSLGETQLLPADWPNSLPTRMEPFTSASSLEEAPPDSDPTG